MGRSASSTSPRSLRARPAGPVALVAATAALVLSSCADAIPPVAAQPVPSTVPVTTAPVTTVPVTTAAPTTTPPATTAPPATAPALTAGLRKGDEGPEVEALQRRLAELRLDPGPPDGRFGTATVQAVWAYQKLTGAEATGEVTPELWQAMQQPLTVTPLVPGGGTRYAEVDLPRQLVVVWHDGQPVLISHVSTGTGQRYCEDGVCGVAVTRPGEFRISRRIAGWRTSRLGRLYNPLYFNGGIAFHGAPSVPGPVRPASHGCVRLPMHIAEYFPSLLSNGDPVYVSDGRRPLTPIPQTPPAVAPVGSPASADPPGSTAPPGGEQPGAPAGPDVETPPPVTAPAAAPAPA